jgi:hypothetical protein
MVMNRSVILSFLLVGTSMLLSGCLTDQQGRPVTPIMRLDPNTGQLYTTYYDGAGREVVLAPNGIFVPVDQVNQGDQGAYAGVDDAPPDPEVDPSEVVSSDPVYLQDHGYYFRNGHWYNGYYWRTHGYPRHDGTIVRGPNGKPIRGRNGQVVRRGPNGSLVRKSAPGVGQKTPAVKKQ